MAVLHNDHWRLAGRMLGLATPPVAWATGRFFLPRPMSDEMTSLWASAGVALSLGLGAIALLGFHADGAALNRDLLERRVLRKKPRGRRCRSVPAVIEILRLFVVFKGFMLVYPILTIFFLAIAVEPHALDSDGRLGAALASSLSRFGLMWWIYTYACLKSCNAYSWLIVEATHIVPEGTTIAALVPRLARVHLRTEGFVLAANLFAITQHATTTRTLATTASVLCSANLGYFLVYHYFLRRGYQALGQSRAFPKRWLAKK